MKFKFITSSLFLLISYFVITSAQANESEQFILGEHYVEVKGEQTSTPQVTEFFSFYCPHCYNSESFMHKVRDLLPEPTQFTKIHVDSMPSRNTDVEHLLTKALVTDKLLNVEDKMVQSIFNYIHKNKADFSTQKDIKNLFLLNGVNSEKFDKTFGSFKVNMEANTMRKKTEALRKQGFGSVPTLIINGKYKPNTKGLKSMDEYLEIVKYLLAKTA
jgi:thiol:disulfide interchange protein DsbA